MQRPTFASGSCNGATAACISVKSSSPMIWWETMRTTWSYWFSVWLRTKQHKVYSRKRFWKRCLLWAAFPSAFTAAAMETAFRWSWSVMTHSIVQPVMHFRGSVCTWLDWKKLKSQRGCAAESWRIVCVLLVHWEYWFLVNDCTGLANLHQTACTSPIKVREWASTVNWSSLQRWLSSQDQLWPEAYSFITSWLC